MRPALLVCVNRRLDSGSPSCVARGSEALADRLEAALAARGLELPLRRIHCFGECARGPNLRLAPGGRFFHRVGPDDVESVLDALAARLREPPGE